MLKICKNCSGMLKLKLSDGTRFYFHCRFCDTMFLYRYPRHMPEPLKDSIDLLCDKCKTPVQEIGTTGRGKKTYCPKCFEIREA